MVRIWALGSMISVVLTSHSLGGAANNFDHGVTMGVCCLITKAWLFYEASNWAQVLFFMIKLISFILKCWTLFKITRFAWPGNWRHHRNAVDNASNAAWVHKATQWIDGGWRLCDNRRVNGTMMWDDGNHDGQLAPLRMDVKMSFKDKGNTDSRSKTFSFSKKFLKRNLRKLKLGPMLHW